jgi:hypothetical protein
LQVVVRYRFHWVTNGRVNHWLKIIGIGINIDYFLNSKPPISTA